MRFNLNLGGPWRWRRGRSRNGALEKERALSVPELIEQVRQAQGDWEVAKQYFQCVTEPDRVDHAIFSWQAAERRYMFLLNELKARSLPGGEHTCS